jgi:hypothetical protein
MLAACILMACVVLGTPGCSYSYDYEIRGTIRSAEDGAPLGGVTVTLIYKAPPKLPGGYGPADENNGSATSAQDGSFFLSFTAGDIDFDVFPKWVLSLKKAGYDETLVDVTQHDGYPKTGANPYLIAVAAHMRAKPDRTSESAPSTSRPKAGPTRSSPLMLSSVRDG